MYKDGYKQTGKKNRKLELERLSCNNHQHVYTMHLQHIAYPLYSIQFKVLQDTRNLGVEQKKKKI